MFQKPDMGLTYGQPTIQSADVHDLQTLSVIEDPQLLVNFMWGDNHDLSLWTRLVTLGCLGDLWKGSSARSGWVCRKGVHFKDSSRRSARADRLRVVPYIDATVLRTAPPVIRASELKEWPARQETVAHLDDALLRVFDGPRVVFPDGFSREDHRIRSAYCEENASFNSSVGVVAGPATDAHLLRFIALYLRSSLVQYFLAMRSWKRLCERNAVHLADVARLPFFLPEEARNAASARSVLMKVSDAVDELRSLPLPERLQHYNASSDDIDEIVFAYFQVSSIDRQLVRETVQRVIPSIRPRSQARLDTVLQQSASPADFRTYAEELGRALDVWRARSSGTGRFHVEIVASDGRRAGPLGVVRIDYAADERGAPSTRVHIDDGVVMDVLSELRQHGLVPLRNSGLVLFPDAHVWLNGSVYIVRYFTQRNWTIRQALRDAEHIFRDVRHKQQLQNWES